MPEFLIVLKIRCKFGFVLMKLQEILLKHSFQALKSIWKPVITASPIKLIQYHILLLKILIPQVLMGILARVPNRIFQISGMVKVLLLRVEEKQGDGD